MAIEMRRNFSGALSVCASKDGTWRIGRGDQSGMQIIVIGADASRVPACGTALHDLDIEWHGQSALVTMITASAKAKVQARTAIVHEPIPALHAALPLADFDARARRFWRRVFVLVRIPGGRHLLGMLARASRNTP
jgi:hypothetical protein